MGIAKLGDIVELNVRGIIRHNIYYYYNPEDYQAKIIEIEQTSAGEIWYHVNFLTGIISGTLKLKDNEFTVIPNYSLSAQSTEKPFESGIDITRVEEGEELILKALAYASPSYEKLLGKICKVINSNPSHVVVQFTDVIDDETGKGFVIPITKDMFDRVNFDYAPKKKNPWDDLYEEYADKYLLD